MKAVPGDRHILEISLGKPMWSMERAEAWEEGGPASTFASRGLRFISPLSMVTPPRVAQRVREMACLRVALAPVVPPSTPRPPQGAHSPRLWSWVLPRFTYLCLPLPPALSSYLPSFHPSLPLSQTVPPPKACAQEGTH